MARTIFPRRVLEAARADARSARFEFEDARQWLAGAEHAPMVPLGAEVWVFDPELTRILLVRHRWRGWVPPGGRVEPGETPREGARRELLEETGIEAELLSEPAAVTVRSFRQDYPVTLSFSYAAFADVRAPLDPEPGQPASWIRLDDGWNSCFPADPDRVRGYARSFTSRSTAPPGGAVPGAAGSAASR